MFEVAQLDLSRQWHTPGLADLGELLVFYDRLNVRLPLGRLAELVHGPVDDVHFFRQLVDQGRITLELDQMPLGEVAYELGLFQNALGLRSDPAQARTAIMEAFGALRLVPANPWAETRDEVARFEEDWAALMTRLSDPSQAGEAFADRVIEHALERMALVRDAQFIQAAVDRFAQTASPTMANALRSMRIIDVEIEGRVVAGFDAPEYGTSAELLEFLSQLDELFDIIEGRQLGERYTTRTFDTWTAELASRTLKRASISSDVSAFQTAVFGRSGVAKAIETGARRFSDLAELLEKREPFAKAMRNRAADASLAKAYFEEIAKISWLSHGTAKVFRYSAVTAAASTAGLLMTPVGGVAVAAVLGAFDYFVLDRLSTGNACRTFVEGDLSNFVAAS